MRAVTGASFYAPVEEELAQLCAECLAHNPAARPCDWRTASNSIATAATDTAGQAGADEELVATRGP